MQRTEKYDLTQGGILAKLLRVALPIMGTQLMQMTYNLTDMFWLGRLGANAVAASGAAGLYMWLSMGFMVIGRVGAEIGVSQSLGRGDEAAAKGYSHAALCIALSLGVFYALVVALFSRQMVSFYGFKELYVADNARTYLLIIGPAVPLTYLSAAIVGTFNASGNSKTPFIMSACGLVLNMMLDPVLIFVFNFGIVGAAVATAISQAAVFLLMLWAIKRSAHRPFKVYSLVQKVDFTKIKRIFVWSTPVALESMFFTVLFMLVSRMEAGFGAYAMAVSRVGSQIESLSWLVGGGYGTALMTFVGQNYGAKKQQRIDDGVKISLGAMVTWGALVTLLMVFGGRALYTLFLTDPDLVALGGKYVAILAICQIPMSLEIVTANAFKGAGRTIPSSIVSISSNLLRVPLCYALSLTPLGLTGIWIGATSGAVLRGLWMTAWYVVSRRKNISKVEPT